MRISKKELQNLIKEAVQQETLNRLSDDDIADNVLELAELLSFQIRDKKHGRFAQSALRKYARELILFLQEAIKRQDALDPTRMGDVDGPRDAFKVDEQMARGNGLVTTTAAQQDPKTKEDIVIEGRSTHLRKSK